jgi:hypothetical protein
VRDARDLPISDAVIIHQGSTYTSDQLGLATIQNYANHSMVRLHKFGFADTTVSSAWKKGDSDSLHLYITLRLKPNTLPEVSVTANAIEEINPLKSDFILGYELKGDYLIELVSDDNVLVINSEGKQVTRSKSLKGALDLVKDAYGAIYIITEQEAFKVNVQNAQLSIDAHSVDLKKLNWNLQYLDAVTDTSEFIRRYKDFNQTLAFFAVSKKNKNHAQMLKEIGEAERKKAVAQFAIEAIRFNQYVADKGLNMMTASTGAEVRLVRDARIMANKFEMNYARPSYSTLKKVNDSIFLFAHDIDSMFVFDQSWNLVRSKNISYHHLKSWGEELIVNEEKTKVYAKFIENSKTILTEVELQTGDLKGLSRTINAKFPTKIKVKGNRIYFMSKQKGAVGSSVYSCSF